MRTSRGLKTKIRAYQDKHGVNYTAARRAVLASTSDIRPADLPSLLIPFPDGPLKVPQGLAGDDLMKAAVGAAMDHLTENALTAPARDELGNLIPPPVSHLRHHLALIYDLGEEHELDIAQSVTSIGVTDELPDCWNCPNPARYDVTVYPPGREDGIGAYVCPAHYELYGSGTLGGTRGDGYLMLTKEVPLAVIDEVNAYMTAQGRTWVAFPHQ
jgi:hypothetical protein